MEGGRMYTVDLYIRVRLACHVDGLSQREAASRFGIARETVKKMLRHSEPPGHAQAAFGEADAIIAGDGA